jgi:hypothetical protein
MVGLEGKMENLQFFLLPAALVVGCADVIIDPALWATEMRKSWISWRLMSDIFAVGNQFRNN